MYSISMDENGKIIRTKMTEQEIDQQESILAELEKDDGDYWQESDFEF
jgi:hypothetical protein